MNSERTQEIEKIRESLQDSSLRIDELLYEEQTALDSIPKPLRKGETGTKAAEAIDSLKAAFSNLKKAIKSLETIKTQK